MGRRRDRIDWKDDLLTGIELAIVVIAAFLFYDYLKTTPDVATVLDATSIGLIALSFGVFIGAFLFIKWLNREKV